ncbi:MAG: DNA-3-methyladenine glycosylase I [Paracoccaceae bacterium]
MMTFAELKRRAIERKGAEALEAAMPVPPDTPLADLPDDRILSEFTKRIFQSGFSWTVIENKWPGFEAAFHGFDIARNAMMSDDDLDRHLANREIVRNGAKILAVRDNAVFLAELAREHGTAARALAHWPVADTIGLFDMLKRRGARLGGVTGQYALRSLGYDAFILSKSAVAALNAAGVISGAATSARAQRQFRRHSTPGLGKAGKAGRGSAGSWALTVPD